MGRDGEVAELTALVGSQGVRLVTLTGPGGSGKTRLAMEVANRLVAKFSDGVFFIALAAVTSADVMWTTIGEALDAPLQARLPPDLFTHLAHRSALLVLDNLEQIPGADSVVTELLDRAPDLVVMSTSRRALGVTGERQHAVPPLELPSGSDLESALASGAPQLFEQQARAVKASFALTAENVADVVAICTRLDGLPLAIVLAAARTKLLGTRALLARLDHALDLAASSKQVPSRQKTLRDTIAWSYNLLSPVHQIFFRRLGVFAGGADLDALHAVASPDDIDENGASMDVLDLVSDLVDASLLMVTETATGEPRVRLLETIRAFALDTLDASGERHLIQRRHALHYLGVAETVTPELSGEQYVAASSLLQAEHGNFREALAWTLTPRSDREPADGEDAHLLGLRLCVALEDFWDDNAHLLETKRWMTLAVQQGAGSDSLELARCLARVGIVELVLGGDKELARKYARESIAVLHRLHDESVLAHPLFVLAAADWVHGNAGPSRALFQEALAAARRQDRSHQGSGSNRGATLIGMLDQFAGMETTEGNFAEAEAMYQEALALAVERKASLSAMSLEHGLANVWRHTGKAEAAVNQMRKAIPQVLQRHISAFLFYAFAEDFAAAIAELGHHRDAVRLLGASVAERNRVSVPRIPLKKSTSPKRCPRLGLRCQQRNGKAST